MIPTKTGGPLSYTEYERTNLSNSYHILSRLAFLEFLVPKPNKL